MSSKPFKCVISEDNLSVAWAKTFLAAAGKPRRDLGPLFVTVTGFDGGVAKEDDVIRKELDKHLDVGCDTVANTIFPRSLWNPRRRRDQLFELYLWMLPRIRACRGNRYGVYFERLIAFENNGETINQLEHIIQTYKRGNHRPSALQATIFNPMRDHTNQKQRGFPCLQSVFFTLLGGEGLAVTGVYACQYLLRRAYGNYLGLCRLGEFMAHELGRELLEMNCVVGKAKLETSSYKVAALAQALRERLSQLEEA